MGVYMLSKLESLYLGVLRSFILVVATLALLAAAILVVTSVPQLLTRMGITQSEPQSSSLAEFIAEQKPADASSSSDDQLPAVMSIDPDVREAARNFHSYLGDRATVSVKDWEQGLQSLKDDFASEIAGDYALSVKRLSLELKESKGKPLAEKRVGALVDWHKSRFEANRAAEAAERATADAAFKLQLMSAFGAFMLFVFITFIFLFVRIERNLRVMRVQVEEPYAQVE